MVLDGASQLDPAALYDAIQVIADLLPPETLETLSNQIGRAAHMKQRNATHGDEVAGNNLPLPATSH
jgi:hypothetical protein